MKIIRKMLPVLFLLLFCQPAFPVDPNNSVKATVIVKTENSWNGDPIVYPSGKAEITGVMIEIVPGGETGWHLHPFPSFGLMLEGEIEVKLKDGKSKKFHAGEGLAEVVNTLHNGRNIGKVPAKLIVFYAGTVGQKITEKEAK
jgi:quercetin dioxygenase-like cupin family protein